MTHWSDLGLRHGPSMSGRSLVDNAPPPISDAVDQRAALLAEPFRGITTNGEVRRDLFPLAATGISTDPVADAASAFLQALSPEQRSRARFGLDAEEWRTWINVHMNFFRHGVMLEDLAPSTRRLAMDLVATTLSARGFALARDIMRINQLVAELTGDDDAFGEWLYFLSIFGEPGGDQPWGWQLDGHHLNLNCVIVGDQLVMTPTFMGAEPCRMSVGPYAGLRVLGAEQQAGLDLVRSLDTAQAGAAILRPSISPDDLPRSMQHPFDGRMEAGAFQDNATLPTQGVSGADLSDAQRHLVLDLVATYVGRMNNGHAATDMATVADHLDETWFSWMGETGENSVFYYRVHSPVILIEFDHHPGVVFNNKAPSRHHIHTVVRTPNGNDYGHDLLRQHHDRYDHSHGDHAPRD